MHLLPCPFCESTISVAPSQAGDQATCNECQKQVQIPKLGQLRQLPTDTSADDKSGAERLESTDASIILRAGFLTSGLIAVGCMLIAGFCGIRWSLIQSAGSTQKHIESVREEYAGAQAAQLVREFEDMDNMSLELTLPYQYKVIENERNAWGRSASIAAIAGGIAVLVAGLLAVLGRQKPAH
ncbi:MAG: hypothetical protein AAGG48_06975 [Planctomycetota bacterium]